MGYIYKDEHMPYFDDGTVPDVIFNIHSLSTRMTVGVLMEGLCNHLSAHTGIIIDASPFCGN